jgi:hypothetical protein
LGKDVFPLFLLLPEEVFTVLVSTLDEQQPRSERLHVFSIIMFLVRVGYTTASADVTLASRLEFAQDGLFLSFWVGLSCYN